MAKTPLSLVLSRVFFVLGNPWTWTNLKSKTSSCRHCQELDFILRQLLPLNQRVYLQNQTNAAWTWSWVNPHPPGGVSLQFSDDESQHLDEREKLRRMRISKANKGNTPWNKGRKHSAETLRKIKERTRLAMQNPKIKMKLINLGHAQTTETKKKIGVGVRKQWERRRGRKMVQESCCFEWQNLIAEASRQGYVGQEELQWNSYETLDEQLKQEWLDSVEQRKQMARAPGSKRAPKSAEQRRKIAEAIAAKWADPEYRERVCSGLAKYHGSEAGAERKPRRRPSDAAQSTMRKPITKRNTDTIIRVKSDPKILPIRLRKSKSPAYKDPLVNSKLEMIKSIRAQRASVETRQAQAIEQARLLIAEAEKAAKALEIAATRSPIAQSSLIETRKLIAEAIQSLESIETQGITESNVPSVCLSEIDKENGSAFEVLNQSQMAQPVYGDPELYLTNGCASLAFSLNSQINEASPSYQQRETEQDQRSEYKTDPSPTVMGIQSHEDATLSRSPLVTKKWVRGRLVEVAEEKQ
ncbi:Nuclease associated modular domain 3 [Sesbania bispinosa]|nr:Nuclease associated modular domain 3 [Sesbania bispinosa]